MQQKTYTLNVQGNSVPCIVEGEGSIPCLFIGPGSLYLPTIPKATKKLFTFYDVDRYFLYPVTGEKVSTEEIQSLTLNDFVSYYEAVRKALGLAKMAVLGPSALGLVAHEYARQYPDTTTHVMLLCTPSSIEKLLQRQDVFMTQYSPNLHPKLATDWSRSKWGRYQQAQETYKQLDLPSLPEEEQLIQELIAHQEKYSIEPESAEVLRERWKRFNMTMRHHFFTKMMVGYEMKGKVTVPTLAINGLYDGIALCYDIPDKTQKEKSVYGKIDTLILEDAAHAPQLESSRFTQALKEWLESIQCNVVPRESGVSRERLNH